MTTPELTAPIPGTSAPPSRLRRWARRLDRIFVATVVIPTILAIVYFGLVASDVYISESRFVVRTPQRSDAAGGGLTALLQTTGFGRATDDTYSVHDYVQSRDASNELASTMRLRDVYMSRDIDVFNRFGSLDWDTSLEAFNLYYQGKVDIEFDPTTSITVLTVRAFTAKDARDINERLVQMSERLLNQMNERSRRDLVETAEREVRVAETKNLDVTQRLTEYRSQGNLLDPAGEAGIALARVGRLRDELLAAEGQLDQLRRLSPANPQIAALSAHVDALRRQIGTESAAVTGKAGSLNAKSGPLGRLQLEKEFADRTLQAALSQLDSARSEAARKHLYLERLVQPNLPDRAMEPRRIRGILTVFGLGMIAWGVVAMLVAIVREHRD